MKEGELYGLAHGMPLLNEDECNDDKYNDDNFDSYDDIHVIIDVL
jgi:hypothetical protein